MRKQIGEKDIKFIDVKLLKFDPQNPRVPKSLQGQTSEKKIMEYMLTYGNIIELMYSIAELGYSSAEPLLVAKEKRGDNYIVVEGNRRLAALKVLNNPAIAESKKEIIKEITINAENIPRKIPCIEYDDREDILDYLGFRHITGVKDWGPLEKATYLNELYEKHKENNDNATYHRLAEMIGSKADYVRRLHMAYKLYLVASKANFYGLKEVDKNNISFSWIIVALGRKEIQKYIGLDQNYSISTLNEEKFGKFFNWLFSGLVKESSNIGQLAEVIASDEAIKRLENGDSLEEALLFSNEPEKTFTQLLIKAKRQLELATSAAYKLENTSDYSFIYNLLGELGKEIRGVKGVIDGLYKSEEKNDDEMMKEFLEFKKWKERNEQH